MTKKWTIFLIILAILVIVGFGYEYIKKINNKKFLSQLKGEVVFVRRDNGVLNIYKINANGTGLRMLYHNEDPINSNSRMPKWSIDGEYIYFIAMRNGKWANFIMDKNGKDVHLAEESLSIPDLTLKRANLLIKKGSVYWQDQSGRLHLVYRHLFQDYKFNPGASEASWSPDKKYIIFQVCGFLKGCRIMIADKSGRVAELTKGQQPDWKY